MKRAFSMISKFVREPSLDRGEPAAKILKRFQTGSCGIQPWQSREKIDPPPPPPDFPAHLIRPPCWPNQPKTKEKDCAGYTGFYCPPKRPKYKYTSFSENIDFIPSGGKACWWVKPNTCDWQIKGLDESIATKPLAD